MTTELWAALIGAIVLLLTNLAGLIKIWGEVARQKADRVSTKASRDSDSREIRDMLLKHDFAIGALKDSQTLTSQVVDDLRDTCAALNTGVAKLDLTMENLAETIKEMKKSGPTFGTN